MAPQWPRLLVAWQAYREPSKEAAARIGAAVAPASCLTRITHRGPCSQPIRVGVVNKPSENRHDHWNTVFKKMATKGDYRKNHLTFSKQSSGSIQRYNAIKSFSLDENFRRTTLIIGNEEAPFFFSDKVQVAHIGSLFDIDSKVLNNWNERSLLEYAKWETKDRVELDVLTRSKNFYRIIQFGLPGGQEFSIARPLQRNGKWVVRHAGKLILRTFERCYITIVCPPSIDHKMPLEKMQNTKIDEQSESDHDDAQGGEASINATLIDATDESKLTVGEHQHSAVASDLEETSAVNPQRSDASKQSHNCKDVDMAESSKLDDAMLAFQNQKSQKTGLMTTCIDEENITDANTSMLVEVSEVNRLSENDPKMIHTMHTANMLMTEMAQRMSRIQ